MKYILFTLFGIMSFFTTNKMDYYQQKDVVMSIEINRCIISETFNEIKFNFENNLNKEIIINTWLLFIEDIYSKEKKLLRFKKNKRVRPKGLKEFLTIPPLSKSEVTFNTEDFTTFKLEKGKAYQIIGKYDGQYVSKCKKKVYNKTLETSLYTIKVCE